MILALHSMPHELLWGLYTVPRTVILIVGFGTFLVSNRVWFFHYYIWWCV